MPRPYEGMAKRLTGAAAKARMSGVDQPAKNN